MELAYGNKISFDKAAELGVLKAADALKREEPDQPWEVVVPADEPVEQSGTSKKETMEGSSHTSLYRALHHLQKGGLHRALGVAEGEPIPQDKLEAAKDSKNEHVRHMANFASVLKGFHHESK